LAHEAGKLFERTKQDKYLWIVIGYSGVHDALFEQFNKSGNFLKENLFWCYRKGELDRSVRRELLDHKAIGIEIKDADEFAIRLTKHLKCFPPDLTIAPFTHLKRRLSKVSPLGLFETKADLQDFTADMLSESILTIESEKPWRTLRDVFKAQEDVDVPSLARTAWSANAGKPWVSGLLAGACIEAGRRLYQSIEPTRDALEQGEEEDNLRKELEMLANYSRQCFDTALIIDPENRVAQELLRAFDSEQAAADTAAYEQSN
jgi:hypothetical protein